MWQKKKPPSNQGGTLVEVVTNLKLLKISDSWIRNFFQIKTWKQK